MDEHGRIARPQLTAWQDFRSAAIVGWSISFQGNSKTIGVALFDGIVPSKETPFWGVPEEVLIDNGKDFRSHYLTGAPPKPQRQEWTPELRGVFSQLSIKARYCKPYQPWSKAIERFFGTVADQFSRFQPGWVGSNPSERPEHVTTKHLQTLKQRGVLLTLEGLRERFSDYLARYHSEVHSELGDTPLNIYESAPRLEKPQPTKEALSVLLMHEVRRKVHPVGIQLDNRRYQLTSELATLVGEQVLVKYDPCHPAEIHVFYDGGYVGSVETAERMSIYATSEQLSSHHRSQRATERTIRNRRDEWEQGGRHKSKEVLAGSTPTRSSKAKVMQFTGYEGVSPPTDTDKSARARGGNSPGMDLQEKMLGEYFDRIQKQASS